MDPKTRSDHRRPATVAPASEERPVDHDRTTPTYDLGPYAREHGSEPAEPSAAGAERTARESALRPAPIPREGIGDDLERAMFDRVAAKDHAAALMSAEAILAVDPTHAKALLCRTNCQVLLERKYIASMGSLERVPVRCVDGDGLLSRSLDARAGFVLSLVDGVYTLEMLLDVSAMPRLDALRILYELMLEGVIRFD